MQYLFFMLRNKDYLFSTKYS